MRASEYQNEANRTCRINWANKSSAEIATLGILGEYGSLASVIKKHHRDKNAYVAYDDEYIEELGDILWYVSTLAVRFNIRFTDWPHADENLPSLIESIYSVFDTTSLLINNRAELANEEPNTNIIQPLIFDILIGLQNLAHLKNTTLKNIAKKNIDKTLSYWCEYNPIPQARQFDKNFPFYEQLPREFIIDFVSIDKGESTIIMMNGMLLGLPIPHIFNWKLTLTFQ